jgi:DNA phosphorothioation-associated putative methyltransferase
MGSTNMLNDSLQNEPLQEINRARTAMRRHRCSRPIAVALADGIIDKNTIVFDYGCGQGGDVQYLRTKKIKASGWDPNFFPQEKQIRSDVVNLGYVLNVIEDLDERLSTLRAAFKLAARALVVSVRVESALRDGLEFADGQVTSAGTFQKFFGQAEFREYLESALKRHVYLVAAGIAYVFSDEAAESGYLATRAFTRRLEYRTDLIEEFSRNRAARRYVKMANRLGRLPRSDEFAEFEQLVGVFGSHQRLQRLALRQVNREVFEGSRDQRREDVLTYLSMLRLQGLEPPPLYALPASIRNDIIGIWRSYKSAVQEGERFLFSIGRADTVVAACRSAGVGKLLPEALYVHKSAENDLPALLRLEIFAAWLIVGEISYDVVKISIDGRALSFLRYPDFDKDAHPSLARSVRVYLPKAKCEVRDYRNGANPPILHRKETMVRPDYPHFDTFRQLTAEEEALGFLSAAGIGCRESWQSLLKDCGVEIVGHSISIRETFSEAITESNSGSRAT